MTVKLYENDSYLCDFEASVVSCTGSEPVFYVELDQTSFFPEGGGQLADRGQINSANVLDVQIKNGVVLHKVDSGFAVGERICGHVDRDVRFQRMQNHSGEHILSGIINAKYGYSNVGFRMGEAVTTLDVNGVLSDGDIEWIEEEANKAIWQNPKIYVEYPSPQELKNLKYRSKTDLVENVRIVHVTGYDSCACCAPHVSSAGEIGIIKILNFYPNKGGTRIEILCGKDALCDYRLIHRYNAEIMRILSAKREEVVSSVKKTSELLTASRFENKQLKGKLVYLTLEVEMIKENLFAFCAENSSYDELKYCLSQLQVQNEDHAMYALFSSDGNDGFLYIAGSLKSDVRPFVALINSEFNGKGGGKPGYAQGRISANEENLRRFLIKI